MSEVVATKKAETAKRKSVAGRAKTKGKATLSADWIGSSAEFTRLTELQAHGLLPSQESIGWRFPLNDIRPQPQKDEFVAFADHIICGFRPPGSHFSRSLLRFF